MMEAVLLFQLYQLPGDLKEKIIYKALNPFTDQAEDILFYGPSLSA